MKPTALIAATLLLAACSSAYRVGEDTDKFSDPASPRRISLHGNAIDYSDPLGTVPTSELNPWVSVDRTSGKAVAAGFYYDRAKPAAQFGPVGPDRWLSVRPGDEIVFLVDGERVVLRASSARIDSKPDRTVGTYYFDYVTYSGTLDQVQKICTARKLEFQVKGSNGAVSYPIGTTSFLDSFLPNLQKFYKAEIAARQ